MSFNICINFKGETAVWISYLLVIIWVGRWMVGWLVGCISLKTMTLNFIQCCTNFH